MVTGFLPVACRLAGVFPENGSAALLPLPLSSTFSFYCGVSFLIGDDAPVT